MKKELSPTHEMVACDVCGRTILKGERTEPYLLPDGSRRLVCDLCMRRAESAGWLRESLHGGMPAATPRAEPRRSLLGRLRRALSENGPATADPGRPAEEPYAPGGAPASAAPAYRPDESYPAEEPYPADDRLLPRDEYAAEEWADEPTSPDRLEPAAEGDTWDERAEPDEPGDRLPEEDEVRPRPAASSPPHVADPAPGDDAQVVEEDPPEGTVAEQPRAADSRAELGEPPVLGEPAPLDEPPPEVESLEGPRFERRERRSRRRLRDPRQVRAVPTNADAKVERALEVFNSSAHRRTVGGLVRTLGEPWVTALAQPDSTSEVTVVVAWELSWYQYRIDLGDADDPVGVADKGHEVDEIDPELRRWNASATEDGALQSGEPRP